MVVGAAATKINGSPVITDGVLPVTCSDASRDPFPKGIGGPIASFTCLSADEPAIRWPTRGRKVILCAAVDALRTKQGAHDRENGLPATCSPGANGLHGGAALRHSPRAPRTSQKGDEKGQLAHPTATHRAPRGMLHRFTCGRPDAPARRRRRSGTGANRCAPLCSGSRLC